MKRWFSLVATLGVLWTMESAGWAAEPSSGKDTPGPVKERAIAAIKKLGGTVELDSKSRAKPVIRVNLRRTEVGDGDLALLKDLTTVQHLDLCMTRISTLKELKNWTNLQTLNLSSTRITDAGLEPVAKFSQLQHLDLSCTGITANGVKHLQGLSRLESLSLGTTKLTNKGLEPLRNLTSLKRLVLAGAAGFTDMGLAPLRNLSNLEYLSLQHTAVSERGIQQLKGIQKLKVLDLLATQVDTLAAARLKPLFPQTRIIVTGPHRSDG
jgi:hypothetical protein